MMAPQGFREHFTFTKSFAFDFSYKTLYLGTNNYSRFLSENVTILPKVT